MDPAEAPYPHCNTEVLHAPGECVYCDMYPERQQARIAGGSPFSPKLANGWRGNIAWTQEMIDADQKYWDDLAKTLHRPITLHTRIKKFLKRV